jgi:hypothetical protein
MSTKHATWGMSYSPTFRHLAERAAAYAVADLENPNLGKHVGRDGSIVTYTPHCAEAVILAVTALEAGINEIAAWLKQGFVGPTLPLPGDFIDLRLTDKWAVVPRVLSGAEFRRGTSPWQDFSALVGLRDNLVHFKWQTVRVPKFMRTLQARGLLLPEEPGIYWVDAALTNRTATWAIDTIDAMFAELARLLGRSDDAVWAWR